MHCTRVTLWTQVLSHVYSLYNRRYDHPVLLATAAAFHDTAREDEYKDYWDKESSLHLNTLLSCATIDAATRAKYVQTIEEKDPDPKIGEDFKTDEQRIVHDADCLDIMRVKPNFNPNHLCFYQFSQDKNNFSPLIAEVKNFITCTNEKTALCSLLEQESTDLYGDLVRLLFANKDKFPIITNLIENDMAEILNTTTATSAKGLKLFS